MSLFKLFGKRDDDQLKIQKSDAGDEWVVKKGFSVLYIGTKEKCKTFVEQSLATA